MDARGLRLARFALLLAIAQLLHAGEALSGDVGRSSFEYLYIEANEGGSSGGHTAIRFGPHVYHFRNSDGLLILDRERADDFFFSYAILGNRNVHISEIDVQVDVEERLGNRFLRRYRAQEAQLRVREALGRDRRLLEHAAVPTVSVGGYGFFQPPRVGSSTEVSAVLRVLRGEIIDRYGDDFLARRREILQRSLEGVVREDPARWSVERPRSPYEYPTFSRAWSSRIADLTAGLAALDVLEQARPLEPAAVQTPSGDEFQLSAAEAAALGRFAGRLSSELEELAGSRREDWGRAFLIGMARLVALEASRATGRFVFIDSFPDRHDTIDLETLQRRNDIVPLMLAETRQQLDAARRYFAQAEDPGELAWERVEERLVRHHELLRAARGESDLRLARGHLVPERSAPYSLPPFELREGMRDGADLARVRARELDYADQIRRLYRYRLVARNCVTELLATLNDPFESRPDGSRGPLGGVVEGRGSLAFIPFVSANQVNARYRVVSRQTLLSYRQARLREMRTEESSAWLVGLRESNTITSRSYERGARDSYFVFFTERPVWLRPMMGAVNLIASLGESVWGLLKLPVDRGKTLGFGLKGTLMSLPELAFVNIRKGSNDWVAPEYRRLARAEPSIR